MSEKKGKSTFVVNKESESDVPPCGCAIGDLLAMQTESDLPACGCAIGDLLAMQIETDPPPSGSTIQDQSKRR
jgi:hypothetical protein